MQIIYKDQDIVLAIKPARVLSTDEPGGMPELVRNALGDPKSDVRTVHRLDRVVSGLMVLARNAAAASELSRQIRDGEFEKEYLAVVHGCPREQQGTFRDLLLRDKRERKTYVVKEMARGVQQAILDYRVLRNVGELSMVSIHLVTGRTHQIRAQFSGRNLPLVGDRKYSLLDDDCEIALWSHRLAFCHPVTKERLEFAVQPPQMYPWNQL
jgi:23S rRNA pseudouridine1911/1915/1917 synthase